MKFYIKICACFLLLFTSSFGADNPLVKHIKNLQDKYFYNLCLMKNKNNPAKGFCEELEKEGELSSSQRSNQAFNYLKINTSQNEIDKIYQQHGGLVVLRNPLTSGNKVLIVGCGNEPVGTEMLYNTKTPGYAKEHEHKGADTIDVSPEYNPSLLGSITDPHHTSYIPDNHYEEVVFENMAINAYRGPVFKEIYRILKPKGKFQLDMPVAIFMEPIGQVTFNEEGFVQKWKNLGPFPWGSRSANYRAFRYDGMGMFVLEPGPHYTNEGEAHNALEAYFKSIGFSKVEIMHGKGGRSNQLVITK